MITKKRQAVIDKVKAALLRLVDSNAVDIDPYDVADGFEDGHKEVLAQADKFWEDLRIQVRECVSIKQLSALMADEAYFMAYQEMEGGFRWLMEELE